MEVFSRLAQDLPRSRYVHLQGWGEPMLHPHFFEMAQLARRAGCRVGTTTNGLLVDEEISRKLVEEGFHVVAFSLAGTGPGNDSVRRGAPMEEVIRAITCLADAKRRSGSRLPEIHIAYMLLKTNLGELRDLPRILRGLPVAQVVVSTLDYVAHPDFQKEVISKGDPEGLSQIQDTVRGLAALGIGLHHNLDPEAQAIAPCTENVLRAVVVAADGEVSPCVYTNMELPWARMWRQGISYPCTRISFGNLREKSLRAIWDDPQYKDFRSSFSKGYLKDACKGCPKRGTNN